MKKFQKIVNIFMLIMITLTIATNTVLATAAPNPNTFTGSESAEVSGIQKMGNNIITIVSTVGSIGAVIVLIVLGIKYMMGSAEEKAEYKKTLMPYIIGAAMIFGASTLAGLIYNFTQNIGS